MSLSPGQLPPPDERGAIVVVTGWRQMGKTTLLLKLRENALRVGLCMGGFLSVARYQEDAKAGIDLVDASTGEIVPLATYGAGGPVRTGHYGFRLAALGAGLRFAEAGRDADLFLVDELGPLELVRGEGWVDVIPMIRARAFGVAFVVVRPELVEMASSQLGLQPNAFLITVDEKNREALATEVGEWLSHRARKESCS